MKRSEFFKTLILAIAGVFGYKENRIEGFPEIPINNVGIVVGSKINIPHLKGAQGISWIGYEGDYNGVIGSPDIVMDREEFMNLKPGELSLIIEDAIMQEPRIIIG